MSSPVIGGPRIDCQSHSLVFCLLNKTFKSLGSNRPFGPFGMTGCGAHHPSIYMFSIHAGISTSTQVHAHMHLTICFRVLAQRRLPRALPSAVSRRASSSFGCFPSWWALRHGSTPRRAAFCVHAASHLRGCPDNGHNCRRGLAKTRREVAGSPSPPGCLRAYLPQQVLLHVEWKVGPLSVGSHCPADLLSLI